MLILISLLLTLWTGARAASERQRWLDELKTVPGLGATWLSLEDGLFSQRGELHLSVLDASRLLQYWQPGRPVDRLALLSGTDLYLSVQTQVLPGWLRHDARLLLSRGTLGEWQQAGMLQASEHHIQWQSGLWSDGRVTIDSGAWSLLKGDLNLQCGPLQLDWTPNADSREHRINWHLESLELTTSGTHLGMTQWQGETALIHTSSDWLVPAFNSRLSRLLYEQGEQRLALSDANLALQVTANKQGLLSLVDLHGHSQLGKGEWQQADRNYQLEQLDAGIALSGIDIQGYQALLLATLTDFNDRQVWLAALNRVTRSGFRMHLDPFVLRLDRGQFTASGDVTSRPFDMAELNGLASFRSLLQAAIEIEANRELAPVITDEKTLLTMRDAGYIDDHNGRLNSRLRMVNGKISANGYAIHW